MIFEDPFNLIRKYPICLVVSQISTSKQCSLSLTAESPVLILEDVRISNIDPQFCQNPLPLEDAFWENEVPVSLYHMFMQSSYIMDIYFTLGTIGQYF